MITFWKKLSHHKNHIDFFISKWLLGSGSHQGHGSSKPAKALGSRGESVVLSWKVSNLTKNLALQKKKRKLHHERLDCALDLRTWQTWDVSCYEVRDPRHEQKRKCSGMIGTRDRWFQLPWGPDSFPLTSDDVDEVWWARMYFCTEMWFHDFMFVWQPSLVISCNPCLMKFACADTSATPLVGSQRKKKETHTLTFKRLQFTEKIFVDFTNSVRLSSSLRDSTLFDIAQPLWKSRRDNTSQVLLSSLLQ